MSFRRRPESTAGFSRCSGFDTPAPASSVDPGLRRGDVYFSGKDMIISPGPLNLLICYLIGSIPFGLILTKIFLKTDIRAIGSGNIGATNVLRTGSKALAMATLLLDGSKGALAIFLMMLLNPGFYYSLSPQPYSIDGVEYHYFASYCGLLAVMGHCRPIWLKFKGGKGVATSLGVYLVSVPYAGLLACGTWLLVAFSFKYSSLAALVAVAVAPALAFFVYDTKTAIVCSIIALLVWTAHAQNIKRLLNGTEPKIGSGRNKTADEGPAA